MSEKYKIEQENNIVIEVNDIKLEGNLYLVENSSGIVLFAHGSGSSRMSPRNRYVAEYLNKAGLSTLLFDLLTTEEDEVDQFTREFRFDIPLLAKRLVGATDWLQSQAELINLNIGYFGSSTGAAAALIAAAERPEVTHAVVSRGGRPDLAGVSLPEVKAPTLLIVGGWDDVVIELNQQAKAQMQSTDAKLTIVEGATHLFEEPGKLDEVTKLAADWFRKYLL